MRRSIFLLLFLLPLSALAGEITRAEVLAVARSYAELRWQGATRNVLQGPDHDGVPVFTPSNAEGGAVESRYWTPGQENIGMPYKWGGFDTLNSFTAGVEKGKAAGDLYNPDKRRLADRAVSSAAVGVDCSGFISRCWKLRQKYGTATLPDLCRPLGSPADLKPGDIMNATAGHVVLFVEWLDETKDRARFYESEPFSKVILSEHSTAELSAAGYKPWRYKGIRE